MHSSGIKISSLLVLKKICEEHRMRITDHDGIIIISKQLKSVL